MGYAAASDFHFGGFTRNAMPPLAMREKLCGLTGFSTRFTRSPRSSAKCLVRVDVGQDLDLE